MKLILSILLFIFNSILFAQSSQFAGDYTRSLSDDGKQHIIEYKLSLNPDGTFEFHSYSKIQGGTPPESNKYGKGKWTVKDNMVTFSTNKKEDLNEKYTLDFNTSKARFVTKNPRDKTDQIVKTKLQFLDSQIPWMKKIDIFKI
ncbi:hypothetical protein [Flavobacterium sp. FlaQc-28]|uniref:hypothetical protein n=1 Tax=Flavobacterium sp. FlaQc-28 TaxID=3374178 RepID=UPI0037575D24